jgi:uncharacterized protein (TIGR03083 family)
MRGGYGPGVQLTPRYDGPDLLRLEIPIADPATPLLRQRARLADLLRGLDEQQWTAPSRCAGWSVQDVITHLVTTNQFWAISVAAGRKGTPTRYLTAFDPVATPAQLVDAVRGQTPAETLAAFTESNAALEQALTGLDAAGWLAPAEAPPGHIPTSAVAAHALWDSWIHERDIARPLGLEVVVEPDEVAVSLLYAATLGPLCLAAGGSDRHGTLVIDASDPEVHVVIELGPTVTVHDGAEPAGAGRISGDAVDLVEALSFRQPLEVGTAFDPADRWMLEGLAEIFDVV